MRRPPANIDHTADAARLPEPHPLQLTPNAQRILEQRYLRRDDAGQPCETPEALFHRVAHAIAAIDGQYEGDAAVARREREYYNLMADLEFLPNTPTLMNAGTDLGQLAACFVLPVNDSMEGIFEAVKHAALIHKSGGGTGFAFSRLRPANDIVQSTHGVSSGPVSFMRVFDTATDTIKQGGARRGANMAILRVDHPDILEFIHCKHDDHAFANFNISVGVTEAFMTALKRNTSYELVNPRDGATMKSLRARDVWEAILQGAWANGDPGLVFLDRINADNPTPALGNIEGTNPCGEQPLLPYEACNLGSINLGRMVVVRDGHGEIDYPRLARVIRSAVGFLDNVVDANQYPLPEIEAMTTGNRKIGLGVMGFADLLLRLNIPYDSDAAVETADEIAQFIRAKADEVSRERAERRGVFPNWDRSCYAGQEERYRNATRTTVAPTGTISILAGATGGIEPLFGVAFVRRNILDGAPMPDVHPYFVEIAKAQGFYSNALMAQVAASGSLETIPEIPDEVRRVFVTAHQIAPEWHVRLQAAFQRHTDNGVSKTVNLPFEATKEEVRHVYQLAHDLGCKGITIYRDRSRESQVLNLPHAPEPSGTTRPTVLTGQTHRVLGESGALYITVNHAPGGGPVEVFATPDATGPGFETLQALCRVATLALGSGVPLDRVADALAGADALSAAVADVLRRYVDREWCPSCGERLHQAAGCDACMQCGFTTCA